MEALVQKYASPSFGNNSSSEAISISGKTVEEVGFEKIERRLAALHELRIVILDGLCVKSVKKPSIKTEQIVPRDKDVNWLPLRKIQELDLSRNLLESWADVLFINNSLPHLRILRLV